MKTNTERFEMSHGTKPRGFGLWFFDVVVDVRGTRTIIREVSATGNFTEARKIAVNIATDAGGKAVEVTVLP